ncbi:hypothetical protein IEQ34_018951 [Dendrobium chrysotoxum]|uniref:Uncharacterized protein n=1 Tax=Dendrobium chrysotoxum TaxID=161865 RepID=A0AAV7G827_DENCH|nr:hypothetical protein IEQ34_018951 [Dendrobium chrysotoxum]
MFQQSNLCTNYFQIALKLATLQRATDHLKYKNKKLVQNKSTRLGMVEDTVATLLEGKNPRTVAVDIELLPTTDVQLPQAKSPNPTYKENGNIYCFLTSTIRQSPMKDVTRSVKPVDQTAFPPLTSFSSLLSSTLIGSDPCSRFMNSSASRLGLIAGFRLSFPEDFPSPLNDADAASIPGNASGGAGVNAGEAALPPMLASGLNPSPPSPPHRSAIPDLIILHPSEQKNSKTRASGRNQNAQLPFRSRPRFPPFDHSIAFLRRFQFVN